MMPKELRRSFRTGRIIRTITTARCQVETNEYTVQSCSSGCGSTSVTSLPTPFPSL